jgi:catechol 2,3-dioxygenase-like lactoylglutathione lyase family enzyme
MQILDHVSITVRAMGKARPFYDAIMTALDVPKAYDREDALGYGQRNRLGDDRHSYLSVFQSAAAQADPKRHTCLRAQSAAQVAAFHAAGIAAGGTDAGAPGPRPHYHAGYYAAFLEDPEGNRIEAVFHGGA